MKVLKMLDNSTCNTQERTSLIRMIFFFSSQLDAKRMTQLTVFLETWSPFSLPLQTSR
jgi:hypothetical protein